MATTTVADATGVDVAAPAYGQLTRLLRYVLPYWWQFLASVALMAVVGLLDAFRVLLIGPIFDRVLNPAVPGKTLQLFKLPGTDRVFYLQQLIPSHFQHRSDRG